MDSSAIAAVVVLAVLLFLALVSNVVQFVMYKRLTFSVSDSGEPAIAVDVMHAKNSEKQHETKPTIAMSSMSPTQRSTSSASSGSAKNSTRPTRGSAVLSPTAGSANSNSNLSANCTTNEISESLAVMAVNNGESFGNSSVFGDNTQISTPVAKVVASLMSLRRSAGLTNRQLKDIDVIISLIVTKKLYDFQPSTFRDPKNMDGETRKFLVEYVTNKKGKVSSSSFNGSDLNLPLGQTKHQSKTDLRKGVLSPPQSAQRKVYDDEKSSDSVSPPITDTTYYEILDEMRKNKTISMIDKWDFDAFAFTRAAHGHPLPIIVLELIERHGLFSEFPINKEKLYQFLATIEAGYFDNPYHNFTHVTDVIQSSNWLLENNENLLKSTLPVEKLALVIGSACHDFNHPGLNNAFLTTVEDPLAILYNDTSILENTHTSRTFEILHEEKFDFLENLEISVYRKFRAIMIDLILATDMSKHANIVGELAAKIIAGDASLDKVSSRLLVLKVVLKMADISNSTRPWEICKTWAHRVMEEFFRQGDEEKQREITVSAMMDRLTTRIPKAQTGFCDFVVKPLTESLSQLLPAVAILKRNVIENSAKWKIEAEADIN
eukprot:TRINITY_DN7649_c0_g1_i1.p1 TRINITY_DN7649_c0_g1~~TRINITY_DN7649_c0_g1_i1.p1  ORF type:complete len:605 (+),score=128.22 TRINITY_DN7649_c0_g1_i1:68-1882(+)